jgi:hypothetical protein
MQAKPHAGQVAGSFRPHFGQKAKLAWTSKPQPGQLMMSARVYIRPRRGPSAILGPDDLEAFFTAIVSERR